MGIFLYVLCLAVVVPTCRAAAVGELLGCFKDDPHDRDLMGAFITYDQNTPFKCIVHCLTLQFKYAAVQNGNECYCDNAMGKYWKLVDSQCNTPCTGDESIQCGGQYANSIYATGLDMGLCGGQFCHEKAVCVTNSDGSSQCRCSSGYYGNGINECLEKCFCSAIGDPHYTTFDGQKIHFQGDCSYTIAEAGNQDCGMTVIGKNEKWWRNRNVAITKKITVIFWDGPTTTTIVIDQQKVVTIDGVETNGDVKKDTFELIFKGAWVKVWNNCGMEVMFDGVYNAHIYIPTQDGPAATGICGDCNGVKDDYRLKNGTDVSSSPDKYSLVGNSYWVPGANEPEIHCNQIDEPISCSDDVLAQIATDKHCGNIKNLAGPFKDCIPVLGDDAIQNLFDDCEYDACALWDDPEEVDALVCSAMAELQTQCNAQAIATINYRTATFCPADCKANMMYNPAVTADQPTCQVPDKEIGVASGQPVEGCVCMEGFLYDEGKDECVDFQNCGCKTADNYYSLGKGYLTEDCLINKVCVHEGGATFLKDEPAGCDLTTEVCTTVLPGPDGVGRCDCKANYELKDGVCTEINWCEPNPCKNGGTCNRQPDTYTCTCTADFNGDHCENMNDYCDPNPCRNGGTCTSLLGGLYECACTADYEGDNCETFINCPSGVTEKIKCKSVRNGYTECTIGGTVAGVQILKTYRKAVCLYYDGPVPENYKSTGIYSYEGNTIWVLRGCRADFLVCHQ